MQPVIPLPQPNIPTQQNPPVENLPESGQPNQNSSKSLKYFWLVFGLLIIVIILLITSLVFIKFTQPKIEQEKIPTLTTELVQLKDQYNKASGKEKEEKLQEMLTMAKERKEELKKKLQADSPQEVIQQVISTQEKQQFPQETQKYIEEEVKVTGQLTIIHGDDFENKRSLTLYNLQEQPQKNYLLHFITAPDVESGLTITVDGFAFDQEVMVKNTESNVKGVQSSGQVLQAATTNTKVAVMMVKFQNSTLEEVTPDFVKLLMFTSTDSIKKFYEENSFQKLTLTGDVFDWYILPFSLAPGSSCDLFGWADAADSQAVANGVNLSSYDKKVYVLNESSVACGALGYSIGNRAWMAQGKGSKGVYVHEIGHTFGLKHASQLACYPNSIDIPSKCQLSEYGDEYDVMGAYPNYFQFNAPHKAQMFWVNTREATSSGVYNISPLETSGSGTQVLTIRKPDTKEYYFVSYRQRIGFDQKIPSYIPSGASIHVWPYFGNTKFIDTTPDTIGGNLRDAVLLDGAQFTDPINGISIKQISHTQSSDTTLGSLTVEVRIGGPPSSSPSPSPSSQFRRVFLTSSSYNGNLGGILGADNKCQQTANSSTKFPDLKNSTWKAWISDTTTSASLRLTHSSIPYKLVDGTITANSWTDLTDHSLSVPINKDENGNLIPLDDTPSQTTFVWTDTKGDGTPTQDFFNTAKNAHCNNWTNATSSYRGHIGNAYAKNGNWTDYDGSEQLSIGCDLSARLYCFEEPISSPSPTPSPTPSPRPKPDLIIEAVTLVGTPQVGVNFDVDVTIKNIGNNDAKSDFPIKIGVSFSTSPTQPGFASCNSQISSLSAGAQMTIRIPNCVIFNSAGTYRASGVIDYTDEVIENDEINNFFATEINITLPSILNFDLNLQSIGSPGNPNPQTPQRQVNVKILNSSNLKVAEKTGNVTYDSVSKTFKGNIILDSALPPGTYNILVKTDRYLSKLIPSVSITQTIVQLPPATLTIGDITGDDQTDIIDFSRFVRCFGKRASELTAAGTSCRTSDLNDDGGVDIIDYSGLVLGFGKRGDSFSVLGVSSKRDSQGNVLAVATGPINGGMSLSVKLSGIGVSQGEFANPAKLIRQIKVYVVNSLNQHKIYQAEVEYDRQDGKFKGAVEFKDLADGQYTVYLQADNSVIKLLKSQEIRQGQIYLNNTTVNLPLGDINSDHVIDAQDTNTADLNDDGQIDPKDQDIIRLNLGQRSDFIPTPAVWEAIVNSPNNDNDEGQAITVDRQGNIYAAGSISNGQNSDIWLRKYDPFGNTLWTRTYGNSDSLPDQDIAADQATAVTIDEAGNVYVVGYETDAISGRDIWIRKYDTNGSELWTKTYSGNGIYNEDMASDVVVDSLGNSYVIGWEADITTLRNIWIRKYNTDGNELWTKIFTSKEINIATGRILPGQDLGFSITIAPDGQVYATGYIDHDTLTQHPPTTWEELWVAKLDADGNVLWQKEYDSPDHDHDQGLGIAADTIGNVYVTGGTVRIEPDQNIYGNGIVQKYSAQGEILWTDVFDTGSNRDERLKRVTVGNDGNIYVIGTRRQVNLLKQIIWIRQYSLNGNLLGEQQYDNPDSIASSGEDIAVDNNGIYIIGTQHRTETKKDIFIKKYELGSLPSPATQPCALTSASWHTPEGTVNNTVNEGAKVGLYIQATGNCSGKIVQFNVWEDDEGDGVGGRDTVKINPGAGSLTESSWVAEYQPDCVVSGRPFCDPPEYYFEANIVGETTKITSSDPKLKVIQAVAVTTGSGPKKVDNLTSIGAKIYGTFNPNGTNTNAWFRYKILAAGASIPTLCGDTDSFGIKAPVAPVNYSDATVHEYFATLTNLTSSSRYYFCAIAQGAANVGTNTGKVYGAVESFTTFANQAPTIEALPVVTYPNNRTRTGANNTPFAVSFTAQDIEQTEVNQLTYYIHTGANLTGTQISTSIFTSGSAVSISLPYNQTGLRSGSNILYLTIYDGRDYSTANPSFTVVRDQDYTRQPACSSLGDVNGDGTVNDDDISLLSPLISGGTVSLTPEQTIRADVDGDGQVTSQDADQINAYRTGSLPTFVLCQPITISNISAKNITSAVATITWTTSVIGKTQVLYGLTRNSLTAAPADPLYKTTHSVSLTNLQPRKLYFYKVKSGNGAGEVESPLRIFKTRP